MVLTQKGQTGLIRASCSVAPPPQARHAQIAQSVEQWIENPRVPGSIPGLGTIFKPEVRKSFGFFIAAKSHFHLHRI
jgi:hypothetical protein